MTWQVELQLDSVTSWPNQWFFKSGVLRVQGCPPLSTISCLYDEVGGFQLAMVEVLWITLVTVQCDGCPSARRRDIWRVRHDTVKTNINSLCIWSGVRTDCEVFGLFSHLIPAASFDNVVVLERGSGQKSQALSWGVQGEGGHHWPPCGGCPQRSVLSTTKEIGGIWAATRSGGWSLRRRQWWSSPPSWDTGNVQIR